MKVPDKAWLSVSEAASLLAFGEVTFYREHALLRQALSRLDQGWASGELNVQEERDGSFVWLDPRVTARMTLSAFDNSIVERAEPATSPPSTDNAIRQAVLAAAHLLPTLDEGMGRISLNPRPARAADRVWISRESFVACFPQPTDRKRLGRAPKVDWTVMRKEFDRLMEVNGPLSDDDREWRTQGQIIEALANFALVKQETEVADSTIKTRVSIWLAEWKAALDGK